MLTTEKANACSLRTPWTQATQNLWQKHSKNELQLNKRQNQSSKVTIKKFLHENWPCPNKQKCNCIKKELCPLSRNCQAGNIVYEATITCNGQNYGEHYYIEIAETAFNKRYSNHKRSLNLAAYKNDTEPSKERWKIKRRNSVRLIKWRNLGKCLQSNRSSLRCNLCLKEKLEITSLKGSNILNRRTELTLKCRYVNKHTLVRHDTKD